MEFNRMEVINFLVKENKYEKYLEIGVKDGDVLNGCTASDKTGVDPDCQAYKGKCYVHCKESDIYFEELDSNAKFDIIFIDGLHVAEQVFRDIVNSIKHLSDNGIIVVHDCNPKNKHDARPYSEMNDGQTWNGDVYAGYIGAIETYNIEHYTVNTDQGCGILIPRSINLNSEIKPFVDWEYFADNRNHLLNIISIDEFISKFKKS